MTLTEFLLARIAEDEQWARYAGEAQDAERRTGLAFISSIGTTSVTSAGRVLAECAAKRAIVLEAGDTFRAYDREPESGDAVRDEALLTAANVCESFCRHLATVYADHDDYREEWRP